MNRVRGFFGVLLLSFVFSGHAEDEISFDSLYKIVCDTFISSGIGIVIGDVISNRGQCINGCKKVPMQIKIKKWSEDGKSMKGSGRIHFRTKKCINSIGGECFDEKKCQVSFFSKIRRGCIVAGIGILGALGKIIYKEWL